MASKFRLFSPLWSRYVVPAPDFQSGGAGFQTRGNTSSTKLPGFSPGAKSVMAAITIFAFALARIVFTCATLRSSEFGVPSARI